MRWEGSPIRGSQANIYRAFIEGDLEDQRHRGIFGTEYPKAHSHKRRAAVAATNKAMAQSKSKLNQARCNMRKPLLWYDW